PGTGKSTLVDGLIERLRGRGESVAVLAVDPNSPYSGGAILGDRIRMQRHHADPGIFIRSMATRGNPGGLARATADMARLMSAAGRDYVIVETVGVGQDEIEIARVAEVTVVVLVPGMGDDIQAIKSGIMEIAAIFAINKSDHPGAARLEQELRAEGYACPIVRTVATEGQGIEALLHHIEESHRKGPSGAWDQPGGLPDVPLDHVAIAVPSLDSAIAFYQSIGLALRATETIAAEKVRVAMMPPLELLEPTAADSPISKFLEKRGPGLHHIALRVPDLQAAVERVRASGGRLLNEPRAGAGGHIYVFVHPASTGGVLLELIQEPQ
ncbi:MAG: methylmalonyl-CoA epimerase, partial [Acidobacteriota bacterium]|nr:methylmalonyl-CoA epimerase [Acidobacteriota bacterium]